MAGNVSDDFADDDLEYATDAAAEIDAEVVEFALDDPKKMPKNQPDPREPGPDWSDV